MNKNNQNHITDSGEEAFAKEIANSTEANRTIEQSASAGTYGVSYSPDKGGYNHTTYGNYISSAKKSDLKPEMSSTSEKKKHRQKMFLAFVVIACVVFSMAIGVGGAYIASALIYSDAFEMSSPDGDSTFDPESEIELPSDNSNGVSNTENDKDTLPVGGSIVIYESSNTNDLSTSFTDIVARTLECVVEINTESVGYSQWSGQYIVTGAGSGVILSKNSDNEQIYYVVTNHHVIDSAEQIKVRLNDGSEYMASLVASDAITDIALLAIEVEDRKTLSVVETINAETKLYDGQDVYAIGNPLGSLGGSVSKGIISKTAREISVSGIKMTLMQIDAAVNPGNSGGGLFDMAGRLIGIVNAKYTDESVEGLGFAIPISTVKTIISELALKGYVSGRPGLGFELADKTYTTGGLISSTSVTYPTVVADTEVSGTYTKDGQTHTLTFAEGDIVKSVNGTEVNSSASLMALLTEHNIGDTVELTVYRQTVKTLGNKSYYTTEEYKVSVILVEYVPVSYYK